MSTAPMSIDTTRAMKMTMPLWCRKSHARLSGPPSSGELSFGAVLSGGMSVGSGDTVAPGS